MGGEDQGPKKFKEVYEVIFIPEGWGGEGLLRKIPSDGGWVGVVKG